MRPLPPSTLQEVLGRLLLTNWLAIAPGSWGHVGFEAKHIAGPIYRVFFWDGVNGKPCVRLGKVGINTETLAVCCVEACSLRV